MAHVRRRCLLLLLLSAAVAAHGPSCRFSSPADHDHHDHHHGHHDHDHHHHHHHHHHSHNHGHGIGAAKLPEELAEEEDLALLRLGDHHHHYHGDHDPEASKLGVWAQAMGCSLLVSMASLVCLTMVPVFFLHGKPSKALVDSLAAFGGGAMLGDAFLHQLPHAFGGEHTHSHDHHFNELHEHHAEHGHSHSHSLKDLSVGLSVLFGIVLFLIVEKVVRYVEDSFGRGVHALVHGHHHHKRHHKLKDDDGGGNSDMNNDDSIHKDAENSVSKEKLLDGESNDSVKEGKYTENDTLRKRATSTGTSAADADDLSAGNGVVAKKRSLSETASPPPSSLVFGYLNLFSDGVHNFTDGMALGSAFLLYGSVGGWSRTLFLLAHELPQEVGDFGILVRSGFTVSKALFFNFLSALVALAGTALALVLGKDPGQSSLIEGFTAGGFIYIAVAGVLPEMNNGSTAFKTTALQIMSLILGMAVALCISLVE